ncbi:hypothetical protein SODALDRAFT_377098 [Sodiomyces alkalinus F11]|uniref:Ras-GAP domain-containing protein n=1 Tax=Sodiomyces alkalinus (strain CBS 110278 / VKM F-3762 / F11) TaxID=1314773 RepID=A0A3N2Q3Z0_SODAK|nr:hypothetical protein SODALDRAFT_377098 [Sodiomyces alkalinus F11]ROT41427.1 hypothetical protein SODALDRAFT_377098 [Sodiomyces alkalinus F11]
MKTCRCALIQIMSCCDCHPHPIIFIRTFSFIHPSIHLSAYPVHARSPIIPTSSPGSQLHEPPPTHTLATTVPSSWETKQEQAQSFTVHDRAAQVRATGEQRRPILEKVLGSPDFTGSTQFRPGIALTLFGWRFEKNTRPGAGHQGKLGCFFTFAFTFAFAFAFAFAFFSSYPFPSLTLSYTVSSLTIANQPWPSVDTVVCPSPNLVSETPKRGLGPSPPSPSSARPPISSIYLSGSPLPLPLYLSTSLPLYLSTSLPLYLSTSLPLYLSTSLPLYLSTSQALPSLYLSTSLPLYLSTSLPLYLSTSLPLYLSTSLPSLDTFFNPYLVSRLCQGFGDPMRRSLTISAQSSSRLEPPVCDPPPLSEIVTPISTHPAIPQSPLKHRASRTTSHHAASTSPAAAAAAAAASTSAVMDRRPSQTSGPQTLNTTPPLDWPRSPTSDPQSPQSRGGLERISANNLHSAFRSTISEHTTIRAVTPDLPDRDPISPSTAAAYPVPYAPVQEPASASSSLARTMSSTSSQTSPRSIARPGDFARRQGVVFNDLSFGASYDSTSSSPPLRQTSGTLRPRTHTMDGAFRQQFVSAAVSASAAAAASSAASPEGRHRVGSFSSSSSQPLFDEARHPPPIPIDSVSYSSLAQTRSSDLHSASTAAAPKEKKPSSSTRRLVKRQASRPTSPQPTVPAVDSLPIPIPTDDANKMLLLMKTLCGRMRGEIEYQNDGTGAWHSGVGYIDEERGALMVDTGHNGPFHPILIPDLRGCRVSPVDLSDPEKRCLAIVSASSAPNQTPAELLLYPLVAVERDLWLAALLCWQQLRPPKIRLSNVNGSRSPTIGAMRPVARRRESGVLPPRQTPTLIKLGQVRLWDKGLATSPRAIVKRPSTRDLRSPATSWRLVSCLLHDNGEIRLTTHDGDGVIAVVELSQLSRCAIQQLDVSVLDEQHCLAIFPRYSSVSTQLSIFRPVYIALENRVLLEVWYVLLRAFALPEIYHLGPPGEDQQVVEVLDLEADLPGEIFRLEKTISMRVTEAKLKPRNGLQEAPAQNERLARVEADPLVGSYLAEVILDGEVRARTPVRRATKNPYWREEYHFADFPSEMPFLSILLKRVDGNPDALHPQGHLGSGSSRSATSVSEAPYGSVDITMDQVEQGKDFEGWLEVYDERQQVVGTMLVKIHHDELVVLHSKEYKGLSSLLHNFPSGLTAQIAHALPGQLRRLSELFLNIFQVSGQANDWLQTLIEDEIDGVGSQAQIKKFRFSRRLKSNESLESTSDQEQLRKAGKSLAGEANLLFRGNTLLTHALEFHMRRAGKEYLDHMLQAKMNEINELNPNCEVDPNRLRPGEDLSQNWNRLIQMVNEVWHCISREPGKCPPELRAVLKYVRSVAEDRYGDWLRTVAYTSVSSFLFLRFICPAILSPKLFGLLRDHPQPRAQRTFTLIAKALQALGNISTFGKKEEWMEPMNKFLAAQRQAVKDYMDAICAIPTERAQAALAPSYSTPMTVLGRLAPTAREGFPALPHLIDEARNCAALVKLWTDINPFNGSVSARSSPTSGGEDDILIFNDMCIALQKRADSCYAKMEAQCGPDVVSHQSVSDLAETLDKTTLDAINESYGSVPPSSSSDRHTYNDGGMARPPGSAGSDVAAAELSQISAQRSREYRRGRETVSARHVSGYSETTTSSSSLPLSTGGGNTLKRNGGGGGGGGGGGRSTRTILSGIMKPFARGESPESASPRTRTGKSTERPWDQEA